MIEKIVIFNLDNNQYGISVRDVNEIIKMQPITGLPNKKSYIEGLTMLRGNICTVLNCRNLLNLEDKPVNDNQSIIIMHNREIAIVVDEVSEILDINMSDIQMLDGLKGIHGMEGIAEINEQIITLLNVQNLIEKTKMQNKGEV